MTTVAQNLQLCCKVFGMSKIASFMGVSDQTVRNWISKPYSIGFVAIYRLSENTEISFNDFTKPLKLSGGEKQ